MLKTVHMAGKQYGGVNILLHTLLQTPTSMLLHRTTKNSHTIVRIIPAQELYLTIPYLCPNIRPYILVKRESKKGIKAGQIALTDFQREHKHLSLRQVFTKP